MPAKKATKKKPAKKKTATKKSSVTKVKKSTQSVWHTPIFQKEQDDFMTQHPNMRALLLTFMFLAGVAVVWASLIYISPTN